MGAEVIKKYQEEQEAAACGTAYNLPPEKRLDDFCAFINEIWFPLHIRGGNCKPTSIAFYKNIAKVRKIDLVESKHLAMVKYQSKVLFVLKLDCYFLFL